MTFESIAEDITKAVVIKRLAAHDTTDTDDLIEIAGNIYAETYPKAVEKAKLVACGFALKES